MRGKGIRYIAAMQQLRTKGKRITSRRRCRSRSLLPCYAGVGMGTGTTDWNLEGTNGTDDAGKKCGASRSRPAGSATYYLALAALYRRRPALCRGGNAVVSPQSGVPRAAIAAGALLSPSRPSWRARRSGAPPPARQRPVGGGDAWIVCALGVGVSCRRVVLRLVWRAVHPSCGD